MAGFTKARATFNGGAMTLAGPADSAFLSNTVTGPTGSPMKRAKVMHTTTTDIPTTADYPQYGGKASDARVYDHGETTSFVPITTVVELANIEKYINATVFLPNGLIPAGSVLCGKHIKIKPETGFGKDTTFSDNEIPLPMVSDAVIHKYNGVHRATFTVAVEGRAQINRNHLSGAFRDITQLKPGDKLVWTPPKDIEDVWTLTAPKTPTLITHAIVFNEYVGTHSDGYIMVFLVGLP